MTWLSVELIDEVSSDVLPIPVSPLSYGSHFTCTTRCFAVTTGRCQAGTVRGAQPGGSHRGGPADLVRPDSVNGVWNLAAPIAAAL